MSSTHETIATRTYILHDHCYANHKPSAAGPQFAGLSGVRARTRTEEMKLPKNWMASIVVRRKFAIGFLSATSLTSPLAGGAFAAYRLSFVWIIMPYFLPGGKGGIGQTPAPVNCTRLSTSRSLAIQLAQVCGIQCYLSCVPSSPFVSAFWNWHTQSINLAHDLFDVNGFDNLDAMESESLHPYHLFYYILDFRLSSADQNGMMGSMMQGHSRCQRSY